jgi:hypothetical protein
VGSSIERAESPLNSSNQAHHDPLSTLVNPPFQEGRPLASSNDKEGWAASTKSFTPDREVFMINIDKDSEGSEYVLLDDYYINDDDYIFDTPGPDPDVARAFAHHDLPIHALNTVGTMKIEDEDSVQKERYKLRNAKRAARK